MSYRILLACLDVMPTLRVGAVAQELCLDRVDSQPPRWRTRSEGDACEARLQVVLYGADDVRRTDDDAYFHTPRNLYAWVEVAVLARNPGREERLAARLLAMQLAAQLDLSVLETRNGVYCRTADAFAAWCARRSHRDTMQLGQKEHVTPAPEPQPPVACDAAAPPVFATPARVEKPFASAPVLPMPRRGWFTHLRWRFTHARPYVIALPRGLNPQVRDSLVSEMRATFHRRNVTYEPDNHRLLVYGRDTSAVHDVVGRARRRVRAGARIAVEPMPGR